MVSLDALSKRLQGCLPTGIAQPLSLDHAGRCTQHPQQSSLVHNSTNANRIPAVNHSIVRVVVLFGGVEGRQPAAEWTKQGAPGNGGRRAICFDLGRVS